MPPVPSLTPYRRPIWKEDRSHYYEENDYWCYTCAYIWFEDVQENIEKLGKKEAFDMAEDPWKKIKSFSSCEDLKEHIKAIHIFSKQGIRMICPLQGCASTNVDIRHHMKVFHGVDYELDRLLDGPTSWIDARNGPSYCQEPDSKNGICGCRIHAIIDGDDCEESWLSCMREHRLYHHGFGITHLKDIESVYKKIDDIINYADYHAW